MTSRIRIRTSASPDRFELVLVTSTKSWVSTIAFDCEKTPGVNVAEPITWAVLIPSVSPGPRPVESVPSSAAMIVAMPEPNVPVDEVISAGGPRKNV